MTEEQLDLLVEYYAFDELLDLLGLTANEIIRILYEAGSLNEEILEELCPL
jgi:hypothetical protein